MSYSVTKAVLASTLFTALTLNTLSALAYTSPDVFEKQAPSTTHATMDLDGHAHPLVQANNEPFDKVRNYDVSRYDYADEMNDRHPSRWSNIVIQNDPISYNDVHR